MKKVSWKPVKPQTIYFLSVDEFTEFMGLGTSARSKLRLIGKYEPKLKKLRSEERRVGKECRL